MPTEQIFRILFAAIFFAIFAISVYHRRRARKQSAQIARKEEGRPLIFLRLLIALPLYGAMLAYLINPAWMRWASISLPAWSRWLAVAAGIAALPAVHWLFRHIGKNISETVLTKAEQELVITGPYRWVRHPLYTVASFALLTLSAVAANGFMFAMTLLAMSLLPALTAQEEKHLLEKFGEHYHHYTQRTGRFLPRLRFEK